MSGVCNALQRAATVFGAWLSALLCASGAFAQAATYENLLRTAEYATIRYFPLGDAQGATLTDRIAAAPASLVGAPAAVTGPMFDSPAGGTGLAIDGVSQHALIPTGSFGSSFNTPDGVSVVVWFRADDVARGTLLGTMDGPGYRNGFQILLGANAVFYLANQYQLTFTVNFGTGDYVSVAVPSVDWTNGDWHMLVATYKNGDARLYLDGLEPRPSRVRIGGVGRIENFSNDLAIGAVNIGTMDVRKRCEAAHVSLHTRALTSQQVLALWYAANGYTGQSVYNVQAVRPWFLAAAEQRVDAALVGDSNVLFGVDASGAYGHQYAMAQGMRAVLPMYAGPVMGGVGFGGWANILSGVSNLATWQAIPPQSPAFIDAQVPPYALGFPTRTYFLDQGASVPGLPQPGGIIDWQSPDFLFDFRRTVQWHLTYARFAGAGSGVLRPTVRLLDAPFAPVAQSTLSTVGSVDEIATASVTLPAGPRAPALAIQISDTSGSGLPAEGPLAVLYNRLIVAEQTTGASLSTLWAVGGESARYAADVFRNFTSLSQIGGHLAEMVRHQPAGQERLLIHIIEGGNDTNDYRQAINLDGSRSTLSSQSAEGHKTNMRTIMTRIRDAWLARGYPSQNLCFLLGPYHPSPSTGPRIRAVYMRTWRELARDLPEFNIAVMDGFGFTSVDEFYTSGWYNMNGLDTAHLAKPGYLNFGIRTWQTLFQAASPSPIVTGACCIASTCTLTTFDNCRGPLTRHAGPGTVCETISPSGMGCCRADFNQDRDVTVQDVFDYLDAFFSGDSKADIVGNGSGPPTIQSLFDFLTRWFSGC